MDGCAPLATAELPTVNPKSSKALHIILPKFFISSSFFSLYCVSLYHILLVVATAIPGAPPTSAPKRRTGAEAFPGKIDYTAAKKRSVQTERFS